MKWLLALPLIALSSYYCPCVASSGQHTVISIGKQDKAPAKQELMVNEFSRYLWSWNTHTGPIGPQELEYFITNLYNNPLYTQEYLPNTFADMIRFLEYGNQTYKNRSYVQQVMRLFCNKLKTCRYINPQAFSGLLDALPKLLERHCVPEKPFAFDLVQREVNQCIQKYANRPSQTAPQSQEAMISQLSQDIVQALEKQSVKNGSTSIEELRKTVQVFCEVSVAKLVWAPEDGIESWYTTKKIGQQLVRLMESAVITDPDDVNDLFISLAERYAYFIELMATDLSPDFYTALHDDLAVSVPSFLEFEEQEPSIEKKITRFTQVVAQAEQTALQVHTKQQLQINVQQLANEHGIILGKKK